MGNEVVADSPGDWQCDSLSPCHTLLGRRTPSHIVPGGTAEGRSSLENPRNSAGLGTGENRKVGHSRAPG
eukprot:4085083-Pyramimonas_sp.AAC.1